MRLHAAVQHISVLHFEKQVFLLVSVLQSQQEEDAERVQPLHLGYARHVYAVGAVRLPHVLW